jgi:ferric-dicitrate binding protein FerR (iron transport regulator)
VIGSELRYDDGAVVESGLAEGFAFGADMRSDVQMLAAKTPIGGTYQVTLPDGSRVWMNAASTLRFPSSFKGSALRKVELTGEAYFEVFKDKTHPFIVVSGAQQVEVLGTHFNINSYPDEPAVLTTLLEGAVRVNLVAGNGSSRSAVLKPDQQGVLKGQSISVRHVDAAYAVAWKNGYFMFNSERLETAMNKISRWYNIRVEYRDASLKDETLLGTISKFDDIGKVLKMIGRTDVVTFKAEGNKIIINRK